MVRRGTNDSLLKSKVASRKSGEFMLCWTVIHNPCYPNRSCNYFFYSVINEMTEYFHTRRNQSDSRVYVCVCVSVIIFKCCPDRTGGQIFMRFDTRTKIFICYWLPEVLWYVSIWWRHNRDFTSLRRHCGDLSFHRFFSKLLSEVLKSREMSGTAFVADPLIFTLSDATPSGRHFRFTSK